MGLFRRLGSHRIAAAALAAAMVTTSAVASPQPASGPATAPDDTSVGGGKSTVLEGSRPGVFKEFHMRDADVRGVLELLSRQSRVNIIATREVTGKVAAVDLYDVTLEGALDAVLKATGFVYYKENGSIYVCTVKQLEAREKSLRKLEVRTFRLNYVTAADAKILIEPALSQDGTAVISKAAAIGISPSKTETGGNSYAVDDVLIVKDYEDRVKAVAAIIVEIDVKPDQVLVEATIIRASLEDSNALGVDFNALSGVDFQGLGSTSNGLQSVTTGTLSGAGMNTNKATFRTDFNSALDPGGMTIGFVSNNVAFFIRALESVTDATVLANPKLLIVNKQRGQVMVGRRDGYLTTTVTETTATQTVEFLETGTRLVVRPFIGRDGYVRMEIHPEDSSGSVEQVGTSVLPTETTTEVTSNVLIRDGHTIVIGGLFREKTTKGRGQVPLLGNIPYLGTLFRQASDKTEREEVIILITPHIVKQPQAEAVSEQVRDDVERFRIGLRRGLHWWGREKLAESHLCWARKELRRGNRDKALWNIDMALSMAPRFLDALRLREQITAKAYWACQAKLSSVRHVIQRMIMQELGLPYDRVTIPLKPRDGADLPEDVRKAFGIERLIEDPFLMPPEEGSGAAAGPSAKGGGAPETAEGE
jgi:type IV pilus assembly protein PilQ